MRPQTRMQRMRELVQRLQMLVESEKIPIAQCCKVHVRQLWKDLYKLSKIVHAFASTQNVVKRLY